MRRVILGTAGHIDHGKTTLVKALTGTDTDRLPEEKARGITIDLGFAHLVLDDVDIGIVDVPGHEGLIRNMLAGATGFDAVLLVIAADEGIMPQTREHLAIIELLGISRLIVALTKSDTVETEWLDLVKSDVIEFLSTTAYAGAPLVATSATAGLGIPELRSVLREELLQAAERRGNDVFRMPIDRVFTVHGTGTVVTGTVWSGTAAVEDAIRMLPGTDTVRVRALQTYGTATHAVNAGERAAFALAGTNRDDVARGDVLVKGSGWRDVTSLTAHIRITNATPIKQRQRVRVHLGTAEVMARVVLLASEWVQLRLEGPIVARVGDRFVLRSYSPVATIGGGVVAELGRTRKAISGEEVELLSALITETPPERVRAALQLAAAAGTTEDVLAIDTGLTPADIAAALASLSDDVVQFGSSYFAASIMDEAVRLAVHTVRQFHDRHPLKTGIERAGLTGLLPTQLADAALDQAERLGLLRRQGSNVMLADFTPSFTPAQRAVREKLIETLEAGGLAPPTVAELTQTLKSADVRSMLRLLEAEGIVIAVNTDFYADAAAVRAAVASVRSTLAGRNVAATEFRASLPVSRKYLIPLLEYMDRIGVTRREGDLRHVIAMEQPESA